MKTRLIIPALALIVLLIGRAAADQETTQAIADRYEQLLLASPQSGAPFDRVIEWYATQGGGLESLQKRWKDSAASDSERRRSYQILSGLLAERLRLPEEARAFYQAAMTAGDAAGAARLLAALETTEGNFDAAAKAYEAALASETLAAVDRMELMRSLALLHQRAFADDKALAVWRDAVKRFPGDPYVLEEAGEAFLAAGAYEEARTAFSQLKESSARDPFRRVAASLRLARTAELEGKADDAVRIYELALEDTSDGSWIHREVRARIEELFRRKDDLPGLLSYYERRTKAVPQDYQSLAAQAAVLDDLGRQDEALEKLTAATKLAPQNTDLRLDLIRSLAGKGRTTEALAEAEALARPADAPAETLIVLGNLHWSAYENSKNDADRDAAIAAWRRIAPEDSNDLARIAQLAEILAAHDRIDEAVVQWQRIVAQSPQSADARQRLAEVHQKRGDKAAALSILAGLTEGNDAAAEDFLTLARIQEKMEWLDEARAAGEAGLAKFPDDYELLNLNWRLASEAKDEKAALGLYQRVWKNAPNEFFAEDAARRQAAFLANSGSDAEALKTLEAKSGEGTLDAADAMLLLRIAVGRSDEAAARKALATLTAAGPPVRAARAMSEIAQAFGSPDDQVAALEAVAAADPRMAADSFRAAARIQAGAGQIDAAIKTVAKLIERSPADSSLYVLFCELATRAGKFDLAADRLKEAIRRVEDPAPLRMQLAMIQQAQGRNSDAAQTLQEAFEKEEREGRRMDIFRRQVELAMQSGTIETLIASLREKQAREQEGGRYGAYLSEIFLLQGDFLAAREELTRSLGRTPDSAEAISRLIDLADRGGDQQEALRLARKLAELEPSKEKRADALVRLLNSGEQEEAMEEFQRYRPEIVKDPSGWNGVLAALRRSGHSAESDAVITEAAAASGSGPLQLAEIGRLRLLQRNYDAAEASLWGSIEAGDFSAAAEAVAADRTAIPQPGVPTYWTAMQPFSILANETQNAMQMMFIQHRGYFPRPGLFGQSLPGKGSATAEQREQIRSLFLLSQLAAARQTTPAFLERFRTFLAASGTPQALQITLLRCLNDTDGLNVLVKKLAADPEADLEASLMLSTPGFVSGPDLSEAVEKIAERASTADPRFAFERELTKTNKELAEKRSGNEGPDLSEADRAKLRERIADLEKHPGFTKSSTGRQQLASLAAAAKDYRTAFRLLDEAQQEETGTPAAAASSTARNQAVAATLSLLGGAMVADDPLAAPEFEKISKTFAKFPNGIQQMFFPGVYYGMGMARSQSVLVQNQPDLVAGDASFPVPIFRALYQAQSPHAGKIAKWFQDRAEGTELSPYVLGAFYADWFAGNRPAAVKRMEDLHEKAPADRTAALLLEAYERTNQPAKALALFDQAAMQPGETTDVRTLRKVRLLRAAGRTDEAREAAERLARMRISTAVREQLANELNLLGVPPASFQHLTAGMMGRSRTVRDKSSQIREQVNKLVNAKKTDDAERIARQILQGPLPQRQDYMTMNTRMAMIQSLKSMNRLDRLQTELQERLDKNPADLDAAIRLAETNWDSNSSGTVEKLAGAIEAHPENATDIGYALQLMERNNSNRSKGAEMLCAIIRNNPDVLTSSGFQINELLNMANEPKSGAVLAKTVAELSAENYQRLFLPSRLSRQLAESAVLNRLAEFSVQAGRPDEAIALLERSRSEASSNLDQGLPAILRLAELQLAQGRKEQAVATMTSLIKSPPASASIFGVGSQSIGAAMTNMLMNRQPGNPAQDLIQRTAKVAEQTGTMELLLAALEEQKNAGLGISPSLIVRTIINQPGIAAEWRRIAKSDAPVSGYSTLPMLPTIITSLAGEKDAAQLIPALLRKIPEAQYGMGGDFTLACLAESLPLLEPYRENPDVKRHIALLLAKSQSDPNASRYLLYSQSYPRAIGALIDAGEVEQARKLFDFTAGERASRNVGNAQRIQSIESRLDAAEGRGGSVSFVCAASPGQAENLLIHWKACLAPVENPDQESNASASWDEMRIPVPKSLRPSEIEIWSGPNPASLERIAKTAKPGLEGSLEAKPSSPFGLLQARWKLPDGSVKSGPLTAYVLGANLIADNGVPDAGNGSPADGFKPGVPGPLGKTAVRYELYSPSNEARIPLATVQPIADAEMLILIGWMRADEQSGNMPNIEMEIVRQNGTTENNGTYVQPAPPGSWRQVARTWALAPADSDGSAIDRNVREMNLVLKIQASSGYNSQWLINGSWAGLQLVRQKAASGAKEARELLERFRTASRKSEYAAAAGDFLAALRLDPRTALQSDASSVVDAFKKAGKIPELFAKIGASALFLPNPLRNNRPTIQNDNLISLLAAEAIAPSAPPEARDWLAQIADAPLNNGLRFVIDAAILQEKAAAPGAKVPAEEILKTLGFDPAGPERERIRAFWSTGRAGSPTETLLRLLEASGKPEDTVALLRKSKTTADLVASRLMLEAWLLAPSDPSAALELWRKSASIRRDGQSYVHIDDDADRKMILRLAAHSPDSGNLVAAINGWLPSRYPDEGTRQRMLVELLYAAARLDSPHREGYAALWADAEIAALKSPGYNASRDRIRELAQGLLAAAEWKRLEDLLALAGTNPSLSNDPIAREFAQLRDIVKFARGDRSVAWPVVWSAPGTNAQKVTVSWQWNIRDVLPNQARFDAATTVADKPVLPEIPGQTAVEILFGEMPSEMKPIAKADGTASSGAVEASLPHANGFLRAVAICDGQRIPGPMSPVLSGRRIYPVDGSDLASLLRSGKEPVATASLTVTGTAPDGSQAVRIGVPGESRNLSYAGPDFPAVPGKFYAARAWVRRAGNGTITISTNFSPQPASKKNALNMILTDRAEATGQWALFSRAVPALLQHTFWIRLDELESINPRFWEASPGTEIAGWELLEIDNWKYADWIVNLADLRQKSGDTPDAAAIAMALALAQNEPLTALDYHGDWLGPQLVRAGKGDELIELYRTAFAAEANPLFARPKTARIYNSMLTVLDAGDGTPETRRKLAAFGIEQTASGRAALRMGLQSHAIKLAATPEEAGVLKQSVREDLLQKARDPESGPAFLKAAISTRASKNGLPSNEFLNLIVLLNDPEVTRTFIEQLKGQAVESIPMHERLFAAIALKACLAEKASESEWNTAIDRAFQASHDGTSAEQFMRWPAILGSVLEERNDLKAADFHLRKAAFARMNKAEGNDAARTREFFRAADALITKSLARGDKAEASDTVNQLMPYLSANSGTFNEDALKLLAHTVNQLAAADETRLADKITTEIADDLEKAPSLKKAFSGGPDDKPAKTP